MEYDMVLFDALAEIAEQAKKLALEKIIIAKAFQSKEEIKRLKDAIAKANLGALEVKICHLMRKPDNAELNSYSNVADFVAVLGNSLKNVSFAVSNKKVDFLLMDFENDPKLVIDKETIVNAKNNEMTILIPASSLMGANAHTGAMLLQKYGLIIKLCNKIGCGLDIVSAAQCKEEMRNKGDLEAIAELFE